MSHSPTASLYLDCTFGHTQTIGSISTEIFPGDFVVVTGANGAGKSTLIDTIAGELETIDGAVRVSAKVGGAGELRFLDPASPDSAGLVTRIADPSFFPEYTLGEHLDLISIRTSIDVNEILDRVLVWELEDLPDTLPARLSSGQRQRANLALQLAVAAPVIVLDEPERHLDISWIEVLCDQLRLMASEGFTIIVASHSGAIINSASRTIEV